MQINRILRTLDRLNVEYKDFQTQHWKVDESSLIFMMKRTSFKEES